MGVGVCYVTARDDTIDRVLAKPPLVAYLIDPEEESDLATELTEQCYYRGGLFASLFGKKEPMRIPVPFRLREGEGEHGDLDSTFGAVMFLIGEELTNNPFGGERVGELTYGYGEIYAVRSDRVQAVAAKAAATVSRDDARSRFDPIAMERAGHVLAMEDVEEEFGSTWENLKVLREQWGHAAERNLGMIVFFS